MRRTSVQPAGGLMLAPEGRTAIEAIMTSFDAVPAGLLMVNPASDGGRSLRMCALPTSASFEAVATWAAVEPEVERTPRLPIIDWPAVPVAPLARSKDSVRPDGAVRVAEDAKVCEVTSMEFAAVEVTT